MKKKLKKQSQQQEEAHDDTQVTPSTDPEPDRGKLNFNGHKIIIFSNALLSYASQ